MLEIEFVHDTYIRLLGEFDASQVARAEKVFKEIRSSCQVDMEGLSYISSAGLGVLLETQQRLAGSGHALRLSGLSRHIRMVFDIAGFSHIFEIV